MRAAEKHAIEIGAVNSPPVLQGSVFRIMRPAQILQTGDACIVHDHVDAAIDSQDFVDDLCPVNFLSNIEMSERRVRAQSLGNLRSLIVAQVGQPNTRTFADERMGDVKTDAARRSGHQGNLAALSQITDPPFNLDHAPISRLDAL